MGVFLFLIAAVRRDLIVDDLIDVLYIINGSECDGPIAARKLIHADAAAVISAVEVWRIEREEDRSARTLYLGELNTRQVCKEMLGAIGSAFAHGYDQGSPGCDGIVGGACDLFVPEENAVDHPASNRNKGNAEQPEKSTRGAGGYCPEDCKAQPKDRKDTEIDHRSERARALVRGMTHPQHLLTVEEGLQNGVIRLCLLIVVERIHVVVSFGVLQNMFSTSSRL